MVAKLDISITRKGDHSIIKDAFITSPFKILPIPQYNQDEAIYLMMMNSSPGILSGDEYNMHIVVEENAHLQLQSQAYQRLFNMENSAIQNTHIVLQQHSRLAYVPHPIVPHENSTFYAHTHIDLADDCTLILSDIITPGRKLFGECFKFNLFKSCVQIYHHQKLILKDNILLDPSSMDISTMGMMEGYTHQGTLLFLNTSNISCSELVTHFYETSQKLTNVEVGISALQANGFILRIIGNASEQLFDFFQYVKNHLWNFTTKPIN